MVKSVAAGTPPFTSTVIDPLGVAPLQFVLSVIVFDVIAGVTLASFTVNSVTNELHNDVVFVATTLYVPAAKETFTTADAPGPSIDAPASSNHSKVTPVVPPFDTPSINISVTSAEPFATQSVWLLTVIDALLMVNTGRSSTMVKVAVLEHVLPGERISVTSTV